jgi:IQ and AAA domain-containing protein
MVHPQKRIYIKKVLESTICRICEVKKDLVLFNPRPASMYVHLDQLLFDLKYDPSIIEIPVPRYFKEFDQIPVDIQFKEPVEKEGVKKKKKKAKKSKKKKKKKADDDDEPKEPPRDIEKDYRDVDKAIEEAHLTLAPIKEIVTEPLSMELDNVHDAIRLIQKNERGRQGRYRMLIIVKTFKQEEMEREMFQKIKDGLIKEKSRDELDNEATLLIQKRMKGVLARKRIDDLRQEEMVFLGMSRKPKNEPINRAKKTMDERKQIQKSYMGEYLDAKTEVKEEIYNMEEDEIREKMLKERRDWIQEAKALKGGKPPEDVKGFYERVKEEDKDGEGEGDGDGDAPEEAKGKGKKEEPKGKGKKAKGAAGDDDDDDKQVIKIGPSEVIQKFDEFYEDYNNIWSNKDESGNYQQHYDRSMAHDEMLPVVQDELKKRVDEMLKIELENMRAIAGIKAKKKKGKKKKGKKKKKKKGPKLPGLTKAFWDIPMETHLANLVKENIVRKLPERSLSSFIGEFNYLHSMLDNIKDTPYDPSMALIR